MRSTLTKSLLKTAVMASSSMRHGVEALCWEYETSGRYRILIQPDDGTEVDLEYDKVCCVVRMWIDGRDVREGN